MTCFGLELAVPKYVQPAFVQNALGWVVLSLLWGEVIVLVTESREITMIS